MWTVATYVLRQRLRGVKRYPLVLMLEPLFRCNLACAGCGKIQHPSGVLRRQLTPEHCFRAADECGAPVVSIPGGEPLLHPRIDEIVAGLSEREARYEATRCLSCGNCFECDNCLAACPEQAIIKLGKNKFYRVDLDLCTGCAACFEQCPCHAIDMVPESGAELEGAAAERVPVRFAVRL